MVSMSAITSTPQSVSNPGGASVTAGIDASCRWPLFALFLGGAFWLLVASVFGLIASIKFHAPDFLANRDWLTYGRVHPAAFNALLYGFCVPTGFGVGLWLMARLGQVRLAQPFLAFVGAKFWHFGVLLGLIGILNGDATGFEGLDMPRYAAVLMFIGCLMIGICGALTLYERRERTLYPSQWFVFAGLLWFPWIYSTANLSLLFFPVRGVVQSSVHWWYLNNLNVVWLGLMGLAATFYFIPRLTGNPLHSRYMALLTFWGLILLGSWGGIPAFAPLPAWMPVLSAVATVSMIVIALTAVTNVKNTLVGQWSKLKSHPALPFIGFGLLFFTLSILMRTANALPGIDRVTDFTWFTAAQTQAGVYGFFALTMFGAVYYIAPRLVGIQLPSSKLLRVHFWCAALGILLLVVPLASGGIVQGMKLNDPNMPIVKVAEATLPFLRASTTGDLLMALGHACFALNLFVLLAVYLKRLLVPACIAAMTPVEATEVKA